MKIAFYDALGVNDIAVKVLGDETLKKIAFELTEMIRKVSLLIGHSVKVFRQG